MHFRAGWIYPLKDATRYDDEFASWVARMHTPALRAEAVRSVWDQAPAEARAHFQVRSDGSFLMDVAWMQGRKAPWGGVAGWVGLIASFAP